MKLATRFGRATKTPVARRAPFAPLREALRRVAAWPAFQPILRVALVAAGLVLLAWVGRSSLVRGVLAQGPLGGASSVTAAPDPPVLPSASPVVVDASVPVAGSAVAATSAAAPPSTHARPRATPDDPVYLNQATLEELTRLPGVGPKRAEAVLALRAKLGRFRQPEDLMRVKGIGRATLRRLRPLLRLEGPDAGAASGAPSGLADPATTRPP